MYRTNRYQRFLNMTSRLVLNLLAIGGLMLIMAPSCKDAPAETDPSDTDLPQSNLFQGPQSEGVLEADDVDEASGLAASRSNALYLWTHNDSGGQSEFYLFTRAGADAGRYQLQSANNIDWEDMAIGPGPDDALNYLFAADIGDNAARRSSYTIYRVPEPDLNQPNLPASATLSGVETINFVYSDEVSRDAETLMVDPATKDIYIVSKREARVGVYRLPYPQNLASMDTAVFQGLIPFSNIVAGDISPDGQEILLKDYYHVYHWSNTGNSIYQSMTATSSRLNYVVEPQGEAITWSADGQEYFTLSEEDSEEPARLYSYGRN